MRLRGVFIFLASVMEITGGSSQQRAWQTLDEVLHSGSVEHRQQGLAALSTIGGTNAEAVRRAVEALQDKSVRVRQSAAPALGKMKAKDAAPALQAALSDTGEVAFAAAKSLIDIGDPHGRDMLIAVLAGERKDTPGMMTSAVRTAKQKMKHPEGLLLMGVTDATGAMFGPASMGITAAADVMALHQKGAPGRAAAAAYLAKDPDPYAVTLLEWALGDDNHFVRMEAVKALGERRNAESAGKLAPLLKDEHAVVRAMAAASIIRLAQ